MVSHVMIAATRKVKEKGEPDPQEAVKKGRIGVQDAAKAADLPPEQQKAIAGSPKPRRAAAEAAEAAKSAASRAGGAAAVGEVDPHAALLKAWEAAKGLRGLWETIGRRNQRMVCRRGFVQNRTSPANRRASYQSSLAIRERLAKANPGNAGWQRYLALSYGHLAKIRAQQGARREGSGNHFSAARHSPENTTLQDDPAWFDREIAAQK